MAIIRDITLAGCARGCDWSADDESRSVDPQIAVEQLWSAGDRVVSLFFLMFYLQENPAEEVETCFRIWFASVVRQTQN